MVKLKEIKMSVHRKYTKDYQSYGFRIGLMVDVEEDESAMTAYRKVSKYLKSLTDAENKKIWNIMEGGE